MKLPARNEKSSEMIDCRGGLSAEQEGKKSALISVAASSMIRPVGCNVGASPCGQQNEAWHGFGCWISNKVKNEIISNFNVECRFVLLGWHAVQSIRWRRWELQRPRSINCCKGIRGSEHHCFVLVYSATN